MGYDELFAIRYGNYEDEYASYALPEIEETYGSVEEAVDAYGSFYGRHGLETPADPGYWHRRDGGAVLQLIEYCVVDGEVADAYLMASDDAPGAKEPTVELVEHWREDAVKRFDELMAGAR